MIFLVVKDFHFHIHLYKTCPCRQMGTLLDENLYTAIYNNIFVFDLEYVGTNSGDLSSCYIWEIGVVHLASDTSFSVTIRPDIRPYPTPFSKDLVQLTSSLLKQRRAVDFNTAWYRLIRWISTIVGQYGNIILIAHNGFKADKPMLEIDAKRHNIQLPYNWYFFDSLIYCRKVIPKLHSYTLNDIHYKLFGQDIVSAHDALPDAVALKAILVHLDQPLNGAIYPSYSTPLQVVKWLGPSCENVLFTHNIMSLEQLITDIMSNYSTTCLQGTIPPMRYFIQTYLTRQFNINYGNSTSIADSLICRWLPGSVLKGI